MTTSAATRSTQLYCGAQDLSNPKYELFNFGGCGSGIRAHSG
jgi:hypothetical protein